MDLKIRVCGKNSVPFSQKFFSVLLLRVLKIKKELSRCHKLKFSNLQKFATWWCKLLIFQTWIICYHCYHCYHLISGLENQSLWQRLNSFPKFFPSTCFPFPKISRFGIYWKHTYILNTIAWEPSFVWNVNSGTKTFPQSNFKRNQGVHEI